ncbi:MAG: Flp pilus assembly protein CpaB [Thalassovita sp.]
MLRSLIIIVALVCGGSAALLMRMADPSGQAVQVEAGPAVKTVQVLVALRHVEPGLELTAEDLAWADWPETALQDTFIQSVTTPDAAVTTVGHIARQELWPGQPIMTESFAQSRDGYLASLLSPGMRAVAIQVSAAKTAGGFVLPNNRVDVLLTSVCDSGLACKHSMQSETILQNVRVLAIDQSGSNPNGENNVLVGKTATLELSPEDAEQIVAAEASGALSLLLRSSEDNEIKQLTRLEPEQIEVAPEPRTIKVNRGGISEIVQLN